MPEAGLPVYRLRVAEWRAVFVLRQEEMRVVKIFHRRDGYAWLDDWDPHP